MADRCFDRFKHTADKYGYTQNLLDRTGGTHKDLKIILRICNIERGNRKQLVDQCRRTGSVMYEICDWCCDHLPVDKPRYLMGVGRHGIFSVYWNGCGYVRLRNAREMAAMRCYLPRGVTILIMKMGIRLFAD
jgi:tRNA-guanine family transglycosylase